ncbi:hypothetical protein [Actinocrispum sp. NPDC049592]|uniref:PspA-associated protein PspAB n=1 Tax=Actinocrispum sp. NPDC049592 TaxID=3154835 RepID=UPI0034213309
MCFIDTLLGRTAPIEPNLDVLFAIPGAVESLAASTGVGAVCFKAAEGTDQSIQDIQEVLTLDRTMDSILTRDEYGFSWAVCRQSIVDVPALVATLHTANITLVDAGFGAALLCTVVVFAAPGGRRLGLVYLFKARDYLLVRPAARASARHPAGTAGARGDR